ncbi:hypothetical protein [Paenibacillus solani]|uniref:hypothetical protein n=1 Tax=Paenibacillus solani TaxID=1705565 RepID=UPI003D2AEC3E
MKFSIALFMIALSMMTACSVGQKEQVKEPAISEVKPDRQLENEEKQQVIQDAVALKKGIFAFANEKGQKLLADPETAVYAGEEPLIAIGQAGKLLTVRYSGKQQATPEDDGRQTIHNFNDQAGQLYQVTEGSAEPNETYFIIPASQFPAEALLTIQRVDPQHAGADKQELQEIKESKGREVEQAWPLIELPDGKSVYLVQFVRQGDDMLASLALKDRDTWLYHDYPATYDPYSTWRVDDGGEVRPELFNFLFAAKSTSGLVLGVQWMGAEGEYVSLLSVTDQAITDLGLSYGRYMSPI